MSVRGRTEERVVPGAQERGRHVLRTRVPDKKGASLFLMIPLERWNVERSCHFRGKSTNGVIFRSSASRFYALL